MSVLQDLLEYQKVDARLREIEQSIAASDVRKKFLQAKKFMESAREKFESQDKRAQDLRRLRDDLSRRAEEIGKLLKLGIDGLFCPGGNAGIIAAYVLSLYNRRIPEDISLVASERSMYSRYAIPPQTTITQDYAAQAKAVADLLDARRRGIAFPRHTVIPYRLIERDSVRENPPPPPEESFRVARA